MTGNCQKLGQGPLSPEAVFFLNQQWLLNFFGSLTTQLGLRPFHPKYSNKNVYMLPLGIQVIFFLVPMQEMKADGEQVTHSGSLLVTHMLPHTESRANEKGSLHKTGQPDPGPPESSQLRGCVVRHRVSLHLRFLGLKQGSREDILYALMFGPWKCMDYCVTQKTVKVCYRWWKINH